jgi:hypothetical protein
MKERSGNVYENKGSAFDRREQSWHVIENKSSYSLKTGLLLKRQVVSRWQVVGGARTGVRIRDSGFR